MNLIRKSVLTWLFLGTLPLFAAKVETVQVPSAAMSKGIPTTVILPDAYATKPEKRFPVLYLLHGAGDDYQGWVTRVPLIKDEADRREFVIVCPDGGTNWYYDSPVNDGIRFETFCAKELVTWVDNKYRTTANRLGRATCGNSMGGHGALWLAIRHRETFATAVALSGGVDVRPFKDWNLPALLGSQDRETFATAVALSGGVDVRPFKDWNLPALLGSQAQHKENWESHTVVNLVPTLKNGELAISLDCGAKDFFLAVNRDLHQRLITAGIDHDYSERPGGHDWNYWTKAFPYAAQFIAPQFERSSGNP